MIIAERKPIKEIFHFSARRESIIWVAGLALQSACGGEKELGSFLLFCISRDGKQKIPL